MDTAFDRLAQDYVWLGQQHHNHGPCLNKTHKLSLCREKL